MTRHHSSRRRGLAIAAALAFAASGASAQFVAESDEPLDITSDRLESEEDIATWIGDVRVLQSESILTTDRLVIVRNEDGGVDEIRAEGNVRYSTGQESITGDVAIYNELTRSINMTGDVVVTQGKQVMSGGDLVYWVDTGKINFTAPQGERVRGIFHTKSLDNNS